MIDLAIRWFRRSSAEVRWRALAALAVGLMFVTPSIWAYSITGSLNEAVGVTRLVPPQDLFVSAIPGMGFLLLAMFYGVGAAGLIILVSVGRRGEYENLSERRRNLVFGSATFAALAGAYVLSAFRDSEEYIYATWITALPGGLLLGSALVFVAISSLDGKEASRNRRARAFLADLLSVLTLLGFLAATGYALRPLPTVLVEDQAGIQHFGLLVQTAPEGTWFIEISDAVSSGELKLLDLQDIKVDDGLAEAPTWP